MDTRILAIPVSALMLAHVTVGALAQDRATPQSTEQQTQSRPMGHDETGATGHDHMMPGGMGGHMMEGHMMGQGMMGPGMRGGTGTPFMMRMMFALMDADGDGTISLQEFQSAHERIFKAMDSNKDGKLTPEEMRSFIHGGQ
jgi:hypothetical protein